MFLIFNSINQHFSIYCPLRGDMQLGGFKACDYYDTFKYSFYPLHSLWLKKWHKACFPNDFTIFSQQNQWLWHDVWTAVTSTYYDVLHSLEEGVLDISNTLHIFLVYLAFLPHLCSDLHTFTEGWNHHPLRSCIMKPCWVTLRNRMSISQKRTPTLPDMHAS